MAVPSEEIEALAEDILADIELSRIPLAAVMLKCARLARWLGDEQHRKVFAHEAGGFPTTPTGIPPEVFELGRAARRVQITKKGDGALIETMSTRSVEEWERRIQTNQAALPAAADRDVSISSANPNQVVHAPWGNFMERKRLADEIAEDSKHLARSRAFAYEYATAALYQSRFSEAATTIFERIRQRVDVKIVTVAPNAAQKVSAIAMLR